MQGWYRNPEMVVALAAVILSVFTVLVGAYSAMIDRAYARASVWPRLEMGQSYTQNSYGYFVSNRGTGPALIEHVRLAVDGRPMADWAAVLDAYGAAEQRQYLQSQIDGRTLSAGQDIQVFQTKDKNLIGSLLSAEAPSMAVEICYCSIYQQCWQVDQRNRPIEVDVCKLPASDRFLQ